MTSISDNGSTVVDKGGTCSKTQLKISDNEKNQSIHIKTKLKNIFFTKEKNKDKNKKQKRKQQQNETKNKARHKNKTQNKTKIKNAKYQQMIHENDYINK